MLFRLLVVFSIFVCSSAFAAADSSKGLSTFDVYVAPYFAPNYGLYEAGSVDKGSTTAMQFGARLGFKLGPIMLGGEFGGAYMLNNSDQPGMTTPNKQKYSSDSTGTLTLAGVHLGIITDRWIFMTALYPVASYEAKSNSTGTSITSTYKGTAYSAEFDFRLSKRLCLGVFATNREFNKLTSGALTDADLDPTIKSLSYGLRVSYLVAFSDFDSIPKIFQGL